MSKKSAREIEFEKQLEVALKMVADRDKAIADRDKAIADRDKAIADRDKKIIDQQKEIESLKKTIAKQNREIEEKSLELKRKNDIILLNNYNQYFSKSEHTKDVLKKARSVKLIEESSKKKRGRKKGKGNHEELDYLTPDKVITLNPDEIQKEIDDGKCIIIGKDVTYKIVKNPASYQLIKIERPKYLYNDKIYQALSNEVFAKSIITPSFVSNAIYLKYSLCMPINKLSRFIRNEYGINISNQSWYDYFKKTSDILEPLNKEIEYEFVNNSAGIFHLDETTATVSRSKDFPNRSTHYFLCGCTTYYDHNIRLYRYLGPRVINEDIDLLSNYKGVIVCDGFKGYNKLSNVKIQRCWVHARRYVSDSIKIRDVKNDLPQVELLEEINKLFEIEDRIAELELNEINDIRNKESKAVLKNIKSICNKNKKTKIDKFKEAINYILGYWDELCLFLTNPCIPIHNNQAERTVGYFVQARKNFQTMASDESAKVNARLFTIAMSAQANGLDVEKYINHVLEELHKGVSAKELLPWSESLPESLLIDGLKTKK